MQTDDLIANLAASPSSHVRPAVRVASAILVGWAVALLGMVLFFGPPLTAVQSTGIGPFVVKTGFAISFFSAAIFAAMAAGRPGQKLSFRAMVIAAPFVVLAVLGTLELLSTPRGDWPGLFLGSTYTTCMAAIAVASLPVMIAALWAYREMAPTRPAVAGMLVGLSSGAAAAVAYALYCPETTASFLLAAYTPGALAPGIAGYLIGPKLLHW